MTAAPRVRPAGFLPGRHVIDGFGRGGFRFGEMSHRGSILALPSGVHAWSAPDPFVHSLPVYTMVEAESAHVDILLIGTGNNLVPLPDMVRWQFREWKIRPDVMTTSAAASTFNVLLSEGRRVAAALVAVA